MVAKRRNLMYVHKAVLTSLAVALCLLSSFAPAVFATGVTHVITVGATPKMSMQPFSPSVTVYPVKMKANPNAFGINQQPNGIGGNCIGPDGNSYPKCGSGTTTITAKNTGRSSFTVTGYCWSVSPNPNTGKGKLNLGCGSVSGFGTIAPGGKLKFTWTTDLYNWPDGTFIFKVLLQGTVGSSTDNSKSAKYTVTVTG